MRRYGIRRKAADYRETFGTDAGGRVLIDLIKAHHVFNSTFAKDERTHLLREGERNAVLRILTIMGYTEKDLLQLSEQEIIYDETL